MIRVFATFISFRKKRQLNSTGLYYCVSVWTPGLAQLSMPAFTPFREFSGITGHVFQDGGLSSGPINPIEEAKRLGANFATPS